MRASAFTPWLIRPLRRERALLWCILASIALHTLVLSGLSARDASAPPVRVLPVLTARLEEVATAPPERSAPALTVPEPSPGTPEPARKPEPEPKAELKAEPETVTSPAIAPKKLAPEPKPAPKLKPKPKPKPISAPVLKPPAPRPAPPSLPSAETAKAAQEASAGAIASVLPTAPRQPGSVPGAPAGAASGTKARSGDAVDSGILEGYRLALIAATRRYKRYPAIAMEKGWQGRVEVRMFIGANGMLARTAIQTSSGHAVLDKQAIDMLRKGKTTVQIPARLRGRAFSVDVPVIFNLDNPNS
jgi:protein TonB